VLVVQVMGRAVANVGTSYDEELRENGLRGLLRGGFASRRFPKVGIEGLGEVMR
jgi:hypothetical protein